MKFTKIITILTLFIVGCSSSTNSVKNKDTVSPSKEIKINNLRITIPAGWREIEDNSDQLFQIWLVNDENNASIVFRNIHLNELSDQTIEEKLNVIAQLILNKRKSFSDNFELLSRSAGKINNLDIFKLRYLLEDKIQNILIVTNGKEFYECLAYFKNDYQPTTKEIENLLDRQEKLMEKLIIY